MIEKRPQDIETNIEEAHSLLKDYETGLRETRDPGEKARYRREINELKGEIRGYEDDLQKYGRSGGSGSVDLGESEFENRIDELGKLEVERLRSIRSPYTLVSAPAGYGKSFLFRRLSSKIGENKTTQLKWSMCHVDFSQAEKDDDLIGYAIRCVGRSSEATFDTSADSVCEYLIQSLSEPLCSDCRRSIVLVLDSVERLKESDRTWFYELLGQLYRRTRSDHNEIVTVRVIIAGHETDQFWNGYQASCAMKQLAPQKIQLGPFERHHIEQMIWKHAKKSQVNLDDQVLIQLGTEVLYLSGGHPKIIHDLVDMVDKKGFAVTPVSEYFGERRGYLVRFYVSRVASAFLGSFEPRIAKSLQTLSVFRRVNANTIQMLVRAGELPPETDEVGLLGDLVRGQCLDKPSIQEPFWRDYLMRRVLAMSMSHESRELVPRYRTLNGLALELYSEWIHNQALPFLDSQRLFSVVEWLFHALQDAEMGIDTLCMTLRAHVRGLGDRIQPALVLMLIEDGIRKDYELNYLIDRRFGEGGASRVIELMRS